MTSDSRVRRLRKRPRLLVLLGASAATLAVTVPLAWASHQFTDVPDGAQFHDDIAAVRGAGITSGCGPSIYCPTAGITREAMAAFIHRGFGRAAVSDSNEVAIGASFVDLGAVTILVGGVAGQTQFVKLDAAVTTYIASASGCPCETVYAIFRDGVVPAVSLFHFTTNDTVAPSGFGSASGAATAVVSVPSGSSQTFRVMAVRNDPVPFTGSVSGFASLTALAVPFGSTGQDILSTQGAGGPRSGGDGLPRP